VLSSGQIENIYVNKKTLSNYHTQQKLGTSKRSKAEARKQDMANSRMATATAAKQWFKDHRVVTSESNSFGHVKIRVEWGSSPESGLAARGPNQTHVLDLAKSYSQFGVIMEGDIVILIWAEDLTAAGLQRHDLRLLPYLHLAEAPVLMSVIVGDHRILALQMLRKAKPNNPDYKFVEVTLVICSKSPANKLMALTYGTLDNQVKSIRRKADGWDCICQIHRQYLDLKETYGEDWKSNSTAKEIWKAYKKTIDSTMAGFKETSRGNFFTIANNYGELWQNISKVFVISREQMSTTKKGKESKVPKKDLGYGWLCHMSEIPYEVLVSWTAQILSEELTTSQFMKRCKTWKHHVKVQKATVAWYNLEYAPVPEVKSYTDLGALHPFFQDAEFFNSMLIRFPATGKYQVLPSNVAAIVKQKLSSSIAVLYVYDVSDVYLLF